MNSTRQEIIRNITIACIVASILCVHSVRAVAKGHGTTAARGNNVSGNALGDVRKWTFDKLSERLIARTDFAIDERWCPKKILGRDYWSMLEEGWGKKVPLKVKSGENGKARLTPVDLTRFGFHELPIAKESGVRCMSPSYSYLFSRKAEKEGKIIKKIRHIRLREIRIFTPDGKNLSDEAIVYGECDGGFCHLFRINDGNTTPDAACGSKYPTIEKPHTGWISFNFDEEKTVGKMTIYHGEENGVAMAFITRHFLLQYHDGKDWQDIPGAECRENEKDITQHTFDPIITSQIRLRICDQAPLYDWTMFPISLDNPFLKWKKHCRAVGFDKPFTVLFLRHDYRQFSEPPMVDYRGYACWKKKYPNFMGFDIMELDNEMSKSNALWFCKKLPQYFEKIDGRVFNKEHVRRSRNQLIPGGDKIQFPPPGTREEAIRQMETVFRKYRALMFNDVFAMFGQCDWHHQVLEWGARMACLEHGGGTSSNRQIQYAFARGAARQYGKPWAVYQANFMGRGYTSYVLPKADKDSADYWVGGPDFGGSASRYRRQLYLTYLAGANFAEYEMSSHAHFWRKNAGSDEKWEFSAHGKALLDQFGFTRRHPDRGTTYTPVALLLDYNHCWKAEEWTKILYGFFQPGDADRMIDSFIFSFFPYDKASREGYGQCMTNTPYGDICDVVVPNPPRGAISGKILDGYKVLILAGDVTIDAELAKRLMEYVHNGGSLVINVKHVNQFFPASFLGADIAADCRTGRRSRSLLDGRKINTGEFTYRYQTATLQTAQPVLVTEKGEPLVIKNRQGKGNVIVTLQHYMIGEKTGAKKGGKPRKKALPSVGYLLSLISHETMPVSVEGDIEYIVNKKRGGWVVGLINNKGVYKEGRTPPVVKPEEAANVTLRFKGRLKSITEWISDRELVFKSVGGNTTVKLRIAPGDLKVLELKTTR